MLISSICGYGSKDREPLCRVYLTGLIIKGGFIIQNFVKEDTKNMEVLLLGYCPSIIK